jgi:hypothetical protein
LRNSGRESELKEVIMRKSRINSFKNINKTIDFVRDESLEKNLRYDEYNEI